MKLIGEIINKRLELSNELDITHEYLKSIWHFYSVYSICLVIVGGEDSEFVKKNRLIRKLIGNFNQKTYARLKDYMKVDYAVVSMAMSILQELKEEGDFYGDYDLPDMVAVGEYD